MYYDRIIVEGVCVDSKSSVRKLAMIPSYSVMAVHGKVISASQRVLSANKWVRKCQDHFHARSIFFLATDGLKLLLDILYDGGHLPTRTDDD